MKVSSAEARELACMLILTRYEANTLVLVTVSSLPITMLVHMQYACLCVLGFIVMIFNSSSMHSLLTSMFFIYFELVCLAYILMV